MRALAEFVMRGRSQAAMMATVPALLALLLPMLGIVSSAVVALVTLRIGTRDGLFVSAISTVASALLAYLVLGTLKPAVGFLLVLWLPAWFLGMVLRGSRSLSLVVQSALSFGLLVIALLYLELGEPQAQWAQILRDLVGELVRSGLLEPGESESLVQSLAIWMTGLLAGSFYLQLLLALFLARSWQAQLYNPSGFMAEFQALQVHGGIALLTLPLFVLTWFQGAAAPALVRDLTVLLAPLWVVQGMAVAHGVATQAHLHPAWLVMLYLLLLVAPLPAVMLVILVGLADVAVDFRSRFRTKT